MQQEQNTIKITFGIISYLRNLFSEESFKTEKIDGINLKVLKNTIETLKMIEWINNLNKYEDSIYKIHLGIYEKERIKEMYSININNRMEDDKSHLDYKAFCRILQKMDSLKGKFTIKLKVFTTSFIEIEGFKKTDEIWKIEGMKEKGVGGIKVYYEDTIDYNGNNNNNDNKLHINSISNNNENRLHINSISNNNENKLHINSIPNNNDNKLHINSIYNTNSIPHINSIDNNLVSHMNPLSNTNSIDNNPVSHMNPLSNTNSIDNNSIPNINIKCPCTLNNITNNDELILCSKCSNWIHPICHGFFSSKDKRINQKSFLCFECSNNIPINKEIRDCCIYRRILNLIYNENDIFITKNDLSNFIIRKLGLSNAFVNKLINKLYKDGFMQKGQNRQILIKNKEIKEKIKEYFNGRRMECFISIEEIEIDAE